MPAFSTIFLSPKPERGPAPSLEQGNPLARDLESIGFGLLVSVLLHLLLLWVLPWRLTSSAVSGRNYSREVEYVYMDSPPEEEEMRFVETNPDVPSNEPDETNNFAARDQQAGQVEDSAASPDKRPFLEGERDDSPKVVEGSILADAIPPSPPPQPQTTPREDRSAVTALPPPPPPAPDFQQRETVTKEEGAASLLEEPDIGKEAVEVPSDSRQIPLSVDTLFNSRVAEAERRDANAAPPQPITNPQQPRPRPRLSSRVLAGPVMRSMGRAPVLGEISVDAKFSEFGDYLQRMFDAIGFQFQLLANRLTPAQAEISSQVIVEYKITRDGKVADLKVIFATAGRAATLICKDAVESPSPFGAWTQEMINSLGEDEPVRITFLYR